MLKFESDLEGMHGKRQWDDDIKLKEEIEKLVKRNFLPNIFFKQATRHCIEKSNKPQDIV